MRTQVVPGSRPLAAPDDWDQELDGECGVLHVVDHTDTLSGQNFMYSFYKPTEEDLQALINGGILRLGIMGRGHPVINMSVMGPEITKEIDPSDGFDMGPVIERGVNA